MNSTESNSKDPLLVPNLQADTSPLAFATDASSVREEPLVSHPVFEADPAIEVVSPTRFVGVLLGAGSFAVLSALALLTLVVT